MQIDNTKNLIFQQQAAISVKYFNLSKKKAKIVICHFKTKIEKNFKKHEKLHNNFN